ncbi:uncharacterized protein LOC130453201 [Diorhabda sublineata]|uniref:uncharacterized protein LOC130453201 n=1 Tax=Diorhabda sublineata TaxID=1163346 RepID=UPI0024E06E16|nr:uncharacterized protein LOC130453201 [Diorhabda sublineata]
MNRVTHLSEREAERITELVGQGQSYREVANLFGVHHTTIVRLMQIFRETGSHSRSPGQGRPSILTPRDERFLQLNSLRNRSMASVELNTLLLEVRNVNISDRSIRRHLQIAGLHNKKALHVPLLTRRHRVAGLRFAKQHLD